MLGGFSITIDSLLAIATVEKGATKQLKRACRKCQMAPRIKGMIG
jgi:hypothetical protein